MAERITAYIGTEYAETSSGRVLRSAGDGRWYDADGAEWHDVGGYAADMEEWTAIDDAADSMLAAFLAQDDDAEEAAAKRKALLDFLDLRIESWS